MEKLSKTEKRVKWLLDNLKEIELSRTKCIIPLRHKGTNSKGIIGMSGGGYGYWVWALNKAGIKCDAMCYWSGSLPTPSTSINGGIAKYIRLNAPADLI